MILRKDYEATFKEGFRLGVRLTRAKECYVRATDAKNIYSIINYSVLNAEVVEEKLASASPETKDAVQAARDGSAPKALMSMTIFPFCMLIAYIGIFMYFKSRGGYKPIEIDSGGGSSSDD